MSSFAFLVNCNEAFGYTHQQTLSSSYTLISAMLAEYSYIWSERNLSVSTDSNTNEVEGVDFVWVELPDWDNPSGVKRFKKYKDVGDRIGKSGITNL
jgi:hypothetical protein